MKNSILAVAILAAGIIFAADSQDAIVSSDIVGYVKSELVSGNFNMSGLSYLPLSSSNSDSDKETFDINKDLVFENLTPGEGNGDGDEIRVWNATTSGYKTFYYYNDPAYPDYAGWYAYTEGDAVELEAGSAYWFYSPVKEGEKKISFVSGYVEPDSTVKEAIIGGNFNMTINAYPNEIDLNNADVIGFENLTPGEGNGDGDEIRVWNATTSGYKTFYYYNDPAYPDYAGWYAYTEGDALTIPAYTAFWFFAQRGEEKYIIYKSTIQ